jgi:putative membrane protein
MLGSLVFASAHHLLAFLIVALLAVEWALLGRPVDGPAARRLLIVDAAYGGGFGVLLLVGIARLIWFEKGLEFYLSSPAFWIKIALLAAIGLISIAPTRAYFGWRKLSGGAGFAAPAEAVARLRRFVAAEALLFVGVPVAAACMARGY